MHICWKAREGGKGSKFPAAPPDRWLSGVVCVWRLRDVCVCCLGTYGCCNTTTHLAGGRLLCCLSSVVCCWRCVVCGGCCCRRCAVLGCVPKHTHTPHHQALPGAHTPCVPHPEAPPLVRLCARRHAVVPRTGPRRAAAHAQPASFAPGSARSKLPRLHASWRCVVCVRCYRRLRCVHAGCARRARSNTSSSCTALCCSLHMDCWYPGIAVRAMPRCQVARACCWRVLAGAQRHTSRNAHTACC
jgi:hypothetical protein